MIINNKKVQFVSSPTATFYNNDRGIDLNANYIINGDDLFLFMVFNRDKKIPSDDLVKDFLKDKQPIKEIVSGEIYADDYDLQSVIDDEYIFKSLE